MKSTLKIDAFDVIIDGVGEQWLKQNHHFIVEAIQKAFEPFEHRNFDERVIDEIEIILPPSNSFDDFLNSLIVQLRSQIVDKHVLSVSNGTQTNEAKTNVTTWITIETLFTQLQNQIGSNSNLASQTLLEISKNILVNNNLIWRLLEKLNLSDEIFQAFQKWAKSENINANLILNWMLQFLQNNRKYNQETVDSIFLKTIFFSQFKSNFNLVSFSKINSDFISHILELQNPELTEYLSYENSVESINALFSNYLNEFDILKNSIDVGFIHKLFKLNNAHFIQQQEPQKKEVLLYFNVLKIANSLKILNYQQLVAELNFYYFNVSNRSFDIEQIIQIFQKYIPANQIKSLDALFEMVFQETKLINFNLNIESNLTELFKKIDLFIIDNFSSDSRERIEITEHIQQHQYQIDHSEIIDRTIQLNLFKSWPLEFAHFIPIWSAEIAAFLKSGGTMSLKISAFSENVRYQFILEELNKIFQLALKNQAENQIKLEDFILGYASILNILLINLVEVVWQEDIHIKEFTHAIDLDGLFGENTTTNVPQNEKIKNKNWKQALKKLRESKYAHFLNSRFYETIQNFSETQILQYLKEKFHSEFAENFIITLKQIATIENSSYQSIFQDQFIQWVYVHTELKSTNLNQTEFLTFNQFTNELNKINFDSYLQNAKTELINKSVSLVKALTQSNEIVYNDEFSAEELTLWNGLIERIQEQDSNFIKRINQIQFFTDLFSFIQKNWILSSGLKVDSTFDFYQQVPEFLTAFFNQTDDNIWAEYNEKSYRDFIQFTSENQVFKLILIQYLSNQISKFQDNKNFIKFLNENNINVDRFFDLKIDGQSLNTEAIFYFFNVILNENNFNVINQIDQEISQIESSSSIINFQIQNVLELIQKKISLADTVNVLSIEKALFTFVNSTPLTRSILESISMLEKQLKQFKNREISAFIQLGMEIGYFNILKLFIQDIQLLLPVGKIESLKYWFNFADTEVQELENQFKLIENQLQTEIHQRVAKLLGEFKKQTTNQYPFYLNDIADQFVFHTWFNFGETITIEPTELNLILKNHLNILDSENDNSIQSTTLDEQIDKEGVETNLNSVDANEEKILGEIDETSEVENKEIIDQKPFSRIFTDSINEGSFNSSTISETQFINEIIAFMNPILVVSNFIESQNLIITGIENTNSAVNQSSEKNTKEPTTPEIPKQKAAEKNENQTAVQEWINQLELQNQSEAMSLVDLQSVFNRVRIQFFKFIKPIAVQKDLQNKSISKLYELISEQENYFNDLTKSPLYIKTPTHFKLVLEGYIQEISNINIEEISLKNHIIFLSAFELLILILKDSINVQNLYDPDIQKIHSKQQKIIEFFQKLISTQKDQFIPILTDIYLTKNEFEIAKETKTIIDIFTKSHHSEQLNSMHPLNDRNLWFQTEIKIDTSSIFSDQANWKYLFSKNKAPLFIQNQNENQLISENLKDSDKLFLLINHPDYKKWMVVMGRNNAEGFLDLSSQISLQTIIEAQNQKFKGFKHIQFDSFKIFEAFKPILTSSALLSLYQLTKFQFLQTQTPMTTIQIAQHLYTSYLSVESEKTLNEIVQIVQIIKDNLPFSESEVQLFNQIVNQQLPHQISPPQPNLLQTEIESKSSKFQAEIATLAAHTIKYPSISEIEIIHQFSLIAKEIKLQNDSIKAEILVPISTTIWKNLHEFRRTGVHKKETQKFIQKIVRNWLEFKEIHWTIIHGFSSVEKWLKETDGLLSEFVQLNNLKNIHPTWNYINQIINQKPIYQLNKKSIAFEISSGQQLIGENEKTQSIKLLEIEVIKELKKLNLTIQEDFEIVSNKAIENKQNKEEEALIIPIKPKIPNILDWETLSNSDKNIEQSILSILLIEGLQLKNTVQISQTNPLGLNQFLSGKAFFRIMGHSSIPMQMIGLLYEGYFGYAMGMLEENWNQFIVPQNSKTLFEKLRTLRSLSSPDESPANWFEHVLQKAENNAESILNVTNFRLIIEEISELIFQKLKGTSFSQSPSSLQRKWISQLLFFKIIQYKDSDSEIGGYFSLLTSEPNRIDYWIHKISDYILFNIEVEYDFWIQYISHLGNHLSESNVLTIFQLSESLKILNKESKLTIEDIYIRLLQRLQNREFEEAILMDFIPEMIPLFYDNQLSKTTQFRELSMLSMIMNERNNIGLVAEELFMETVEIDSLFEKFKDIENAEIDTELLREITLILGKNTDITSRWILNEIAMSDVQKLQRITAKIQESYQTSTKIPNFFQTLLNHPEGAAAIQEIILPITINLKEKPKSDTKIKREIENGTRFLTGLCGLMLLAPFLSTLFRRMGLLEKNEFISEMEQLKAYKVLMTIPKIDETETFEFQDLIPRIITGIAPEDTINYVPELTDEEITELTNFLNAVISQWPVMANSTLRGFIESFLLRDGKVWKAGKVWKIEVNGHGADIILQTLTWGFATMKFPWTPYMIETDWKSP